MNNLIKNWTKDSETSSQKTYRSLISRWKDARHHKSLGYFKLKDTEIPLHTYKNGQNPHHWQQQMLTRTLNNRNPHSLLEGMQNGSHFGRQFGSFLQIRHTLSIRSSKYASRCLFKELRACAHLHECLWQLYSSSSRLGCNQHALY